MIGVALAALSSILWGSSDFAAGVGSRRAGALRTSLWAFVSGTLVLVTALLVSTWSWSPAAMLAGVVSGAAGAIGTVGFFASLSLAPVGVASAIVAACQIIVPIIIGVLWKGDAIGAVGWVGLIAASAGAVIVGGAQGGWGGAGLRAVLLAAVSGVSFGVGIVALDAAPRASGFLAPAVELLVGFLIVALMLVSVGAFRRIREAARSIAPVGSGGPAASGILFGLLSGVLLGLATIVLMQSLWIGPLTVVGPITCLYPVTAAILARVILKEHLRPMHIVGIVIALGGCVLLGFV